MAKFTLRKNGTYMATFRPKIHIGLETMTYALLHRMSCGHELSEYDTRKKLLDLTVEYVVNYGVYTIRDDDPDEDVKLAEDHALSLFPELKPPN